MLICDYIVESIDGDRSSRRRTEAGSKSTSAI